MNKIDIAKIKMKDDSRENKSIQNKISKAFQRIAGGIYPESFNKLTIREVYNQTDNVISIHELVLMINNSKVLGCFILEDESGRKIIDCNNRFIFENIKHYIKEPKLIKEIYPGFFFNRFSPCVELFFRNFNEILTTGICEYLHSNPSLHHYYDDDLVKFCTIFNHFFMNIKKEAKSPEFKIALALYQDQ